jgi:hypothetical protein
MFTACFLSGVFSEPDWLFTLGWFLVPAIGTIFGVAFLTLIARRMVSGVEQLFNVFDEKQGESFRPHDLNKGQEPLLPKQESIKQLFPTGGRKKPTQYEDYRGVLKSRLFAKNHHIIALAAIPLTWFFVRYFFFIGEDLWGRRVWPYYEIVIYVDIVVIYVFIVFALSLLWFLGAIFYTVFRWEAEGSSLKVASFSGTGKSEPPVGYEGYHMRLSLIGSYMYDISSKLVWLIIFYGSYWVIAAILTSQPWALERFLASVVLIIVVPAALGIPQIGLHLDLMKHRERILKELVDQRDKTSLKLMGNSKGASGTLLYEKLKRFDRMISNTRETSTWAFDFARITGPIIGSSIPLFAVLIQVLLELLL